MTRQVFFLLLGIALISPVHADSSLGRLFYSPQERAALDRVRRSGEVEARAIGGGQLSINGQVVRSTGERTLWINGQARPAEQLPEGWRTQADGRVVPPEGEGAPPLMVGDRWQRGVGTVQPLVPEGAIRIERGPHR